MRDSLRLYLRYIGISVRGQMQFRASFLMMTLGFFVITASEFVGVWGLFARFGNLRGWRLPEVALLYGVISTAFALAEMLSRGFDTFGSMVKNGDFDRLLLRPRSTLLQLAGQELHLMRLGRLAQAVGVMAWAAAALGIGWTLPRVLTLAGAVAGGTCLFCGIFVLQATLAFWTVESLEIAATITNGGVETAQFPLSIYRPWFRAFFTFAVPLAFISYYPALAILGRPSELPRLLLWLAPVVGVLFLLIACRIWEFGVAHYRSTGS